MSSFDNMLSVHVVVNPRGRGCQIIIYQKFCRKLHENEINRMGVGGGGGGRGGGGRRGLT